MLSHLPWNAWLLLLKDSSIIAITVAPGNIFKGVLVKRRPEEKRVVRENSHLLIRLKVLPALSGG